MPNVKPAAKRVAALMLILLSLAVLVSGQSAVQSQEVVNTALRAQIDAASARVDVLGERVRSLESIKPDAIVVRLGSLEEKFNDQQKLLWGIIVAVVVNLLTGSGKFPGRRSSDQQQDGAEV